MPGAFAICVMPPRFLLGSVAQGRESMHLDPMAESIFRPRSTKRSGARRGKRFVSALSVVAALAVSPAPPAAAQAANASGPAAASSALEAAGADLLKALSGAAVSWVIADLESGTTLHEYQPDLLLTPGSNQKTLTAVAALARLGPDFRFDTHLEMNGVLEQGRLHGDLVIRPSGDPTLSRRFLGGDGGEAAMRDLAAQVASAGVVEVTGQLMLDATAWDSLQIVDSWMASDLPFGYAARGGPFVLDEGTVEIIVDGRPDSSAARVSVIPSRWQSQVTGTVPLSPGRDSANPDAIMGPNHRWRLTGRQKSFSVDTLRRAMADPALDALHTLQFALQDAGVSVRNGVRIAWSDSRKIKSDCDLREPLGSAEGDRHEPRTLGVRRSPPLLDILPAILGPSQNWMAEQVVRRLADGCISSGTAAPVEGSWKLGLEQLEATLVQEFGVSPDALDARDGSGLSPYNLVTNRALVAALLGAQQRSWGTAFKQALAEPGEAESTLERRLRTLRGRLFAKTGSLTHVNSLSGYLTRDDGSEVAFSIITNTSGRSAAAVRSAIDRWILAIAGS